MSRRLVLAVLASSILACPAQADTAQRENFLLLATSADAHRFHGLHQEAIHLGYGALFESSGLNPDYHYFSVGRLSREGYRGNRYSVGFGWRYPMPNRPRWYVDFSFAPTYLTRDFYPDDDSYQHLGSHFHFASRFALGWKASRHVGYVFQVEHLSNGGIHQLNPGTNQVGLAVAIDL